MIKMHIDLQAQYPLFLTDFNETWFFSTDFRKILQYQILWKSLQWETICSMRKEGQTNRQTRRNFVNSPKNFLRLFYFERHCTGLIGPVRVVLHSNGG